jgi:hypothetical protein
MMCQLQCEAVYTFLAVYSFSVYPVYGTFQAATDLQHTHEENGLRKAHGGASDAVIFESNLL